MPYKIKAPTLSTMSASNDVCEHFKPALDDQKIKSSKNESPSTTTIIVQKKMSSSWRVMLNGRLWNQRKYEEDYVIRPEVRRLAQSKGRRHMVSCPKKGDVASFVLKGKVVMRGIVESDSFENGTNHQQHSCNTGENRPHAVSTEFVWINITEVGLSEDIRPTGQATWAKMPV